MIEFQSGLMPLISENPNVVGGQGGSEESLVNNPVVILRSISILMSCV